MNSQLSRRSLLGAAAWSPLLIWLRPSRAERAFWPLEAQDTGKGPFTLPPLPYKPGDLEPHIDRRTMEIHHDRHHAGYVSKLNELAGKHPEVASKSPIELVKNLDAVPDAVRTAVRNNAGGHVNHTMFWEIMKPRGGGEPTGAIADVIKANFGSLATFQERFNEAGLSRFGSGWVWLVRTRDGKYEIMTTPNQDTPYMEGHYPIMGNDVWEHAYYLKYQNRRAEYLKAWWNVVDWERINRRLAEAS